MDALNYKSLDGKSVKELMKLRGDMRRKLMNLRFQKAAGSTSIKFSEFRKAKKLIAQINTYMNASFINKLKKGN